MYFLAVIAVLTALTFYFYQKFMKIVKSVDHIPGPPCLPFIGNAFMLIGLKTDEIIALGTELVKKYGHTLKILLGPKVLILVGDPKDIAAILTAGASIEKSEEYEYTKDWIGEGLITSSGQKWHSRRKIITPAFHFNILQTYVAIFERNSEILVKNLSKFESLDIFPLILLCALDNICEAAMGTKINAQLNSDSSYVSAVEEITNIVTKRHHILPLRSDFIFKLSGLHKRQKQLLKIIHGFTDSVIVARRNELTEIIKDERKEKESQEKPSLMDILLRSTINGEPLSNIDIREKVDTFMFAGHDTASSGIAFCLYNIAKYEDIQQKIYDEIKSVIGEKPQTQMNLNDLQYLERVIKESMRLFPPVPFIGRKMTVDSVINEKVFPKNSNVVISPFIMSSNADIWKNPKEFQPERFELDNMTNLHPFAYSVFSAGPRNCIGMKFAMLEIKSTIVKVLSHFKVSLEPGFKIGLKPEIVLKPSTGVKLTLKPRLK